MGILEESKEERAPPSASRVTGLPRRRDWLRPASCLAGIVLTAAVGIVVLNTHAPRPLEVDLTGSVLRLPTPLSLTLDQGRRLHLRGYEGRLERLMSLSVVGLAGGRARPTPVPSSLSFAVDRRRTAAPSLEVQPRGNRGPLSIRVAAGIPLRGDTGGHPPLHRLQLGPENGTASRSAQDAAQIEWEVDGLYLEANRLGLPELRHEAALASDDAFNVEASGGAGMVRGRFQPAARAAGIAALELEPESGEVALLRVEEEAPGLVVSRGVMVLSGAIDGDLVLDGKRVQDLKGADVDLAIKPERFEVRELALVAPSTPGQPARLRLRGRGVVRSVQRNERELLPTMLEDIQTRPPSQRGLFGLFVGFVMFAATIFGHRALSVLSVLFMPDPKSEG